MLERLEDLGVPSPGAWPSRWRRPASTTPGWTEVRELAGPATGAALRWVAASLTARGLAADLHDSASRMGDLVTAIKSYAYMDRGELVQVDVHEGLKTTLVVLGHKLKHTVDRGRAATTTARCRSSPSAAPSSTRCGPTSSTTRSTRWARPAPSPSRRRSTARACASTSPTTARASRPRPSRTSSTPSSRPRPVGQGTGLGLDTARQIVEEHHAGTLGFDTGPDGTTFHVWLPIEGTVR